MDQLLAQYPWLVILAAVLVGMLIMWLLELFILRRNIKSNLTELDASLKQRDAELQTTRATLAQTETALKGKSDELTSTLNARAAAETQIADLKTQLSKNAAELDATRQARQQLETALNTRTAEANDLRAKLTALTTETNDQRAQLAALIGERDELRANLNGAHTELDETRAHQRGALAEVAKLTAAAAATAAVVKGLETSKSELTAQITRLNSELSTARGDAEYLRNRLDEADAEKAKLETLLAEAAQRVDDLNGIQAALKGQVGQLQDKNRALDADIGKLTAGALAASEIIKLLEGEKAALTAQTAQQQRDFEALQKAKALGDAELAELKLQLSHVNTALGITMRDKESYQQTLAARVEELGEAQTQLVRAKEDNNTLLADIAKFTARAAAAAALVQGLEGDKRDLTAQVERLRTELDTERAQSATLKQSAMTPSQSTAASETPAALAATTPEADDDSSAPFEAVCPQDLSAVMGVGTEFEQRLYNAGIGTYWDLSQRSEQELAEILNLGDAQSTSVNLAAIRGDALRLARETKTQKRTWKGGAPDDFDRISGIGRVYEGRLYEAGICTYAALAQCSVEQLAAICRAPQLNASHFQNWIDQARALSAG